MKKRRKHHIHKCGCQDCSQHPHSRQAQQHKAVNRVVATFDEKSRRHFAGLLALQFGRGGVSRAPMRLQG
jgi:hypothetical protein